MKWLLTCLLFFNVDEAQCQVFNYNFTNYKVANGLADNAVQCVMQDSRGFMWFGTREGLSRFDGVTFKNYFGNSSDSNSLPGNNISALNEYRPGNLLFLSNGKVCCFNTKSGIFSQPVFFRSKIILNITAKADGYFFCTKDSSFVTNAKLQLTDTLIPPLALKDNFVLGRELDPQTWLLFSMHEFFLYNPVQKKYSPLHFNIQLPSDKQIYKFQYYDAARKELYISNYWEGFYCFSLDGKMLRHWNASQLGGSLSANDISFICPKAGNVLWIGTVGGGLNLLHIYNGKITVLANDPVNPSSIAGNDVMASITDKDNNEWLATLSGISKLSSKSKVFSAWKNEQLGLKKNDNLLGIVKAANHQLYIAPYSEERVISFNTESNQVTPLDKSKFMLAWSINNLGDDIVVAGAGKSITLYNPITKTYRQTDFLKDYFSSSDVVILAFRDSHGDSWYSGNNGGGLVRVSAQDGSIHPYKKDGPNGKFSVSYYASYAEDVKGDLWFAVNKSSALLHWNRITDQFNEVLPDTANNRSKSMFLNGVNELCSDERGNIWIAYDGSGIAKYDPINNRFEPYTIQEGLSTSYVYALEFDGRGRLWIGTVKGLSCLLPDKNKFINFTVKNGLPEDYFNERCIYFDSSANRMWIGSRGTLISFNPDSLLNSSTEKLPVYIDEFFVNGKKINEEPDAGVINFKPSENNLLFRFIAVDVSNGNDIEYSYKLNGLSKDWIMIGSVREVSFAELAPGNYSLSVRVKHKGDTEWNEMQQAILFVVQPPWFKTWWFKILLALSILGFLFLSIRAYFKSQLQKQKIAMEKELAIEQERNRMARELHDGMGSMLSGIKHSFSAIKNDLPLDETQEHGFDNNIEKLNASIRELRNISHQMSSVNLMPGGLGVALQNYCNSLLQPGGLIINFEALHLENVVLKEEQSFHILRIIQELLNNIIRHADATEAIVQLSYNEKILYITVEDNGRGFSAGNASVKNGLGLKNIESRIKILKGKMDIRSAHKNGTSVLIEIPGG